MYSKAAVFSNSTPCTNVPIHCPLCPLSVSGNPQTVWKYNVTYHLITEHSSIDSNGTEAPPIPPELLIKMFIHKQEEQKLGITEKATQDYGSQWNIPDSEGFEEVQTALGGRKRAETGSSVGCSDNHDSKKGRLDDIQEGLVG